MLRSICLHDLDFRQIPLVCRSACGAPYQKWVRVGMPKIPERIIRSVFYLYSNEDNALAGREPKGTGFIVELLDDPLLPSHYYGITNWHVIRDYPVVRLN